MTPRKVRGTEKEVRSASAASNFEGETATQRRRLQTAKKKKNYCFERLSLCSEQGYIGEARRRRGGGFSKTSSFFLLPLSPSLPDWREIGHVLSTSTSSSHLHFPQSKNTPKRETKYCLPEKKGKVPFKKKSSPSLFSFPEDYMSIDSRVPKKKEFRVPPIKKGLSRPLSRSFLSRSPHLFRSPFSAETERDFSLPPPPPPSPSPSHKIPLSFSSFSSPFPGRVMIPHRRGLFQDRHSPAEEERGPILRGGRS